MPEPYIVWGPELSPFLLKLEALLAAAGVPFRRLPRDGGRLENLRTSILVARATRSRTALRPPANDPLDEYPLVPFLVTPAREVLYDSSALAAWIDERVPRNAGPLVPRDPAVRFIARLIDEAFDEFGLYMVHHNRWKLAAQGNDHPGRRLAREYARQLPPGSARLFADWFERRQVRRLPYLFSVAPAGYREDGLAASLTPPPREGFPPTHALLEQAWARFLAALEPILSARAFLLGEAFTLADASVYGQLSMNLTDPAAARRLRELAPRTFAWLERIRARDQVHTGGTISIAGDLAPLLDVIFDTFVPLMQANATAWRWWHGQGERLFNEKAFDAGRAVYDGTLMGHAFRSVARTFQVRVWRDLCDEWQALGDEDRQRAAAVLPRTDVFDVSGGEGPGALSA